MADISIEELGPGVILEIKKPNGKTYQYSIPQYTPGSGGNGGEFKQPEVDVFCIRNDVVQVVRCKDCKHYLIADEFEGGKRYMCEVNHFSYINSDGDMRYCSYGERKDKADAER